jgi:hypothetical protein
MVLAAQICRVFSGIYILKFDHKFMWSTFYILPPTWLGLNILYSKSSNIPILYSYFPNVFDYVGGKGLGPKMVQAMQYIWFLLCGLVP